ncbi:unnamed protein product, partial [Brenthis ino]
MIFIIFIIIIATVSSVEVEFCDSCIKVDESTCYNVSYLFDIDAPFGEKVFITKLGVLRSTNTLYFSFQPAFENEEYFKIGFVNIETPGNTTVISGGKQILNFGTFDLDQDNSLVYLGGSDGIYVLDTTLNRVAPYGSRGDIVISLFYRGHVYFVRKGEFKIIKKKGDNFDVLVDVMAVTNFVINKYNVIVFVGTYGLFASYKGETVWISKNRFFRGLVIDKNDDIYAWWIDGIYRVIIGPKFSDSSIVKLIHIPVIGAMTFDSNNDIIFTVNKSLFRLIKTSNTTVC